jgi:type I restriction enzyme R subunit
VDNVTPKDSYLIDTVLDVREGGSLDSSEEYENYRLKVNRYIEENKDNIAIYKLRNNMPLTKDDYTLLEKILMSELGTPEEYQHEYGNTPLGLLVRKIAKLDIEAANMAFSEFLNEQVYSHEQIRFVKTIVDYVVRNGYIDELKILTEPPFDKPAKLGELFNKNEAIKIVGIVNKIRENAEKVAG